MADSSLADDIKQVLAAEWQVTPAEIPDDAALNHYDKWDSLGHIAVLLALQEHFKFELSADTVQSLTSLPRMVRFLGNGHNAELHPHKPKSVQLAEPPHAAGWDPVWEENVYSNGRHLNRYPHHELVRFIYSEFGAVETRRDVRILELGCGAGNNLWFAAREGFTTAGIDGSTTAIEYARGRFAEDGLVGDLRVGDFSELPWPDDSFDVVVDRGSLTCVRRAVIEQALDESKRVLGHNGWMFSMIYSDQHPQKALGRDLGDNTVDEFTAGYFKGLGTVHFASRREIDELYGSRFHITGLKHHLERDELADKITNALWIVSGVNKS